MAKTMEQAYAEADDAYQRSQVIPRWTPPVGDYTAVLTDVMETMVTNKEKAEELVIFVIAQIADGDLQGKRFVMVRSGAKTRGMLKQIVELTCGASVGLKADVEALRSRVGTLFSVSAVQNGQYVNVNVNDVIGGQSAPASA